MSPSEIAELDRFDRTGFEDVFQEPPSALTHPLEPAGTPVHGFDKSGIERVMAGIHARGDRLMLRFLAAHMGVALLLAFHFHTWTATILIGGAAITAYAGSVRLSPGTFFTRCMAGLALQTFVALHIYQLHGLAEMHFFFFTGFTMMLVYQDGLAMWPGCIAIILQHIVFAVLHNQGVPLHFFEVPHITFTRLFYHFGIAIGQVAICGGWAHLLRRQTLRDAWQKTRLREAGVVAAQQLETIRESEAALRDAWERQRAILDNIPDLAWVQDPEGRFIAVNHAFVCMTGRPIDDILGHDATHVLGAEAAAVQHAENRRVATEGEQCCVEEIFTDRDGAPREMETIRGPVFDGRGQVVGTIGIARDITDRKRAERERREIELRMQEAQKLESLGVLAGGIAHDFNNLLVGVLGNASHARESIADDSPVADLLDEVQVAAQRAADLTRQMLAYAGRGQVIVGPVDLSGLVREMAQLLSSAITKRADLRLDLAPDLPSVSGDPTQLRQVVMNLLTNASEALHDRPGVITIRTHAIGATNGTGPLVAFVVTDTGVGMDQATRARMFEPFFTTKFTGRGLGLSAAQGIVRAHGGTLHVESEPGAGTTFEIRFPACERIVTPVTHVRHASAVHGAARRLLVIDDEHAVRRTAVRILEHAGYHVEDAPTGEDGVARVRAAVMPFDAVIVDLTMPGMNGIETVAAIRAITPGIPTLLISGYHESDLPPDTLNGGRIFLPKPYTRAELIDRVAALFAGTQPSTS